MSNKIETWFNNSYEKYTFPFDVLDDGWIDDQIKGRENEVKILINYIVQTLKGYRKHSIIKGDKGFGKTYIIKIILDFFENFKENKEFQLSYIDMSLISPKSTKKKILSVLDIPLNKYYEYCTVLKKYNQSKHHVFIFDHFNNTPRLKEYIKKIILPIINSKNFSIIISIRNNEELKKLSESLNSQLDNFTIIDLHPYTQNDLFSILNRRISLTKITFERWALRKITENFVNNDMHDCGKLLGILRYAVILKLDKNMSTLNIIEKCKEKMSNLDYIVKYFDLSNSNVINILEILLLPKNVFDRNELYNFYCIRVQNPYSKVWLHKLLHKLEKYGIIEFIESSDPKKRKKNIKLKHNPIYLRSVIEKYKRGDL